jgi:pimeloyl-ACP methyl ester carboxylesterase
VSSQLWPRLALCLLLAAMPAASASAAAAATSVRAQSTSGTACDATQVYPSSQPAEGSVAVLFVHGLDSFPGIWGEGPGRPITAQVAALPGVTAWTFDYSSVAVQWVTNPQIGPALASTITCLAQLTGQQVIVVGHSMGGLATQYAVSQTGSDGGLVASHVAEVITIGTPTKGSLSGLIAAAGTVGIETATSVLGGLPGKALVAGVEALHSACAGAVINQPQADPCGWFGLDETPAGRALLYGSAELAALPPWPTGLPVVAMAGNIDEGVTVGRLSISVPLGDVIVSLGSATAYDTSGAPFIATCPNVSILSLLSDSNLCYHHNLPHNSQIEAAVLAQIRAHLPPTASPTASPAPSAGGQVSYPPIPSSDCIITESGVGVAPPDSAIAAHELEMWEAKCDVGYPVTPVTCLPYPQWNDAIALVFECTIDASPQQTVYFWANRKNGSWIETEGDDGSDYGF